MTHEGLPRVIAVIGAGAMGSGIAQTALAAGLSVVLYDARQDALRSAADRILARLRDEAAKGRVPVEVAQAAG